MMLSLVRAFLVGALIALLVPVAVAAATMSGMAGPRYQIVDLLPYVSSVVAALLLSSAIFATLLNSALRLPRGIADGVAGALISGGAMFYGAGVEHVFADLGLGPIVLSIFGAIIAILSGILASFRWQLSGRPGA
ncbi:MAG: hypothetical protein AAGI89_03370 [Pseudomonadota bacterium]